MLREANNSCSVVTAERRRKESEGLPSKSKSPYYSTSSSPAAVAVMAMALSLVTYLYNSYISFNGGDPVVQTTLGLVQGSLAKSREGYEFYEFLGIKYGEPPIADLRFEVGHTLSYKLVFCTDVR